MAATRSKKGVVRILIVEDEALVAESLTQLLVRSGYVVPEVVASGEEAIKAVAFLKPDLILMDIKLKGAMNGVEVAIHVQRTTRIPIVFLTAHSPANYPELSSLDSSRFTFLKKPYFEGEVIRAVEILLN